LAQTKKEDMFGGSVTEDDHLVITASTSTYGNELFIKDLTKPDSPIVTS
jgi:prolyl oligopeptidase